MKYITFFAITFLLINCNKINKSKIITKGQTEQSYQGMANISVDLNYYLYIPENYNDKVNFPLILFLHGSGERGNKLSEVKKWGLPKFVDSMEIPFIVVSPQCPANQDWNAYHLKALLNEIVKKYKVDVSRIYLTGLSMGGYATYEMAIMYPHFFAAIAPLSAAGRTFRAGKIAHIPTWAFHGAMDEVVPLKAGKDMVEAIKKAGGKAKLTTFPNAKHVCWDEVYTDPKLYEWFLSNKK